MKILHVLLPILYITVISSLSHAIESWKVEDCMSEGCHERMKKRLETVTIKHPPASRGSCTVCHNSHGDDPADYSLKRPVLDVCFSCHVELGERIRSARFIHALVREDRCADCHEPHGASVSKLLKKFYPSSEWEPVTWRGRTRICLDCHEQSIILAENADTGTGFRNGLENLHRKHVSKKKGGKCESCHALHGSDQHFHIRTEVPLGPGIWQVPVTFTRTEMGGSCVVGCHGNQTYNRENTDLDSELRTPSNEPSSEDKESHSK